MRRRNLKGPDDPWLGGQRILSNGLAQCLDAVERASGWPQARPGHSLGVACTAHISGLLATGAIVRVLEDGSIVLNTGAVDIGQGSNTVLTQLCTEALKVPVERVSIASPDTDGSPYNWGTTASRITYTTGRSVVGAAAEVEKQLKAHAGEMLECSVEDLELLPGGQIAIKGVADRAVSFGAISARAHWAAGGPIPGAANVYKFPVVGRDPQTAWTRRHITLLGNAAYPKTGGRRRWVEPTGIFG